MAEINDVSVTSVAIEPILVNCKFENLGYLCYQLDDSSKKMIMESLTNFYGADKSELLSKVEQFLNKNGHCTLVGNFGNANKKSFSGKGAVRGVLQTFPNLKKGIDVQLMITHLALLNGGEDLIAAKVVAVDQTTILRENLPQDQGLDPEIYQGQSHITCWANDQKGVKPVQSNDVLRIAFPQAG